MDILLFSIDPVLAGTIGGFLRDLGHDAIRVHSGAQLLSRLESDPEGIDLIITDIAARRAESKDLLLRIHRINPCTWIILTTSPNDILPPDQAVGYGVYAYLRKPVSLFELELLLIRMAGSGIRRPCQHGIGSTGSSVTG